MNETHPILQQPIESLCMSEEFIHMCYLNHFNSIGEILALQVNEMLKKPEFGMRMLKELYQLLEDNNLERSLKE